MNRRYHTRGAGRLRWEPFRGDGLWHRGRMHFYDGASLYRGHYKVGHLGRATQNQMRRMGGTSLMRKGWYAAVGSAEKSGFLRRCHAKRWMEAELERQEMAAKGKR